MNLLCRRLFLCSQSVQNSFTKGCKLRRAVRCSSAFSHLRQGPGLKDFITKENIKDESEIKLIDDTPYLAFEDLKGVGNKVFIEVYGCQMNVNDADVVLSILLNNGYTQTTALEDADVLLIVTCAIREGAEDKIWERLRILKGLRKKRRIKKSMKIGLLGCMAERLKQQILEVDKTVDVVAGPDSYKDLPRLLSLASDNQTAVNVQLSIDETYADIMPVRVNPNEVSAYVSIMRGCDNMCTYCIVPFTRGRERSRPLDSILNEVKQLSEMGIKEVTLLGQNVNSYRDLSSDTKSGRSTSLAAGFRTVYKPKLGGLRFDELLDAVAGVNPNMRIRFTSPHPKDFPDAVLDVISKHPNICRSLHLPAQSGSTSVLERMRRGYSRQSYLDLVARVRSRLPSVALSSDFIAGFCGETEDEFMETLSLLVEVRYSTAFLFAYSMREKTTAHRRLIDDIPKSVKNCRVEEMINVFRVQAKKVNAAQIGQKQLVLVEGESKRSKDYLAGRNDGNVKVILPKGDIARNRSSRELASIKPGDYIVVMINDSTSQVLKGIPLYHSSITQFHCEDYEKTQATMIMDGL